ncbi:hypothetical protein H4R35_006792 [Dimargaris xerosporica]|nr:hypothetical protein H4R35_006792 [Dimargaris xerosporica]
MPEHALRTPVAGTHARRKGRVAARLDYEPAGDQPRWPGGPTAGEPIPAASPLWPTMLSHLDADDRKLFSRLQTLYRPPRLADTEGGTSVWRQRLFQFMEDPLSSPWSFAFNVFIGTAIVVSVVSLLLESLPSFFAWNRRFWVTLDTVYVAIFTAEFFLRLLCHTGGVGPLVRHLCSFLTLADLAAIVPYYVLAGLGQHHALEAPAAVFRVFRLFRLFSVFKYMTLFQLSIEVITITLQRCYRSITVLMAMIMLVNIIAATILYYMERGTYDEATQSFISLRGKPSEFDSIPQCLWVSMIAFTSNCFGQINPVTQQGRVVISVVFYAGVLLIALPCVVMSQDFVVVWQAMKLRRRRIHQQNLSQFGRPLPQSPNAPELREPCQPLPQVVMPPPTSGSEADRGNAHKSPSPRAPCDRLEDPCEPLTGTIRWTANSTRRAPSITAIPMIGQAQGLQPPGNHEDTAVQSNGSACSGSLAAKEQSKPPLPRSSTNAPHSHGAKGPKTGSHPTRAALLAQVPQALRDAHSLAKLLTENQQCLERSLQWMANRLDGLEPQNRPAAL